MTSKKRITILQEGITLTSQDRNQQYGSLQDNLECSGKLYGIYKAYAGDKHNKAHDEAIRMLFHKISRIACGKVHEDNYIDGCVYLASAGEYAE